MGIRKGIAVPLLLVLLAAVGGGILAARLLAQPDAALLQRPEPGAGTRVQHALGELVLRATGVSTRSEPLVLSDAELNGFLARHVEARRLHLRPLLVRAEEGSLHLVARTSPGQLTRRSLLGIVVAWLPGGVRDLDLGVAV